jgi:hypothetical protein
MRWCLVATCLGLVGISPFQARSVFAEEAPAPAATDWSREVIRGLVVQLKGLGSVAPGPERDSRLAEVASLAYRVERRPGESLEQFAKRAIRVRTPEHPNVKRGQWLNCLSRQLYADISQRLSTLGRFSTDRTEQSFFDQTAQQTAAVASMLVSSCEICVEGLEGCFEPLPIAKGTDPYEFGAMAVVRGNKLTVERLDRVTFQEHQAPYDAPRTEGGAFREVYSAFKQYNVQAQLLCQYEPSWCRNRGHVRAVVPGPFPAMYLNEIARAGRAAEMTTLHVMVMTPRGELRELVMALKAPKPNKKKPALRAVHCDDASPMQLCVDRLFHAKAEASIVYQPD